MVRHRVSILLGALFSFALLCNGLLIVRLIDGARVLRQAAARVGHPLSCLELYYYRELATYFDGQPMYGSLIYIYRHISTLWLSICIALALGVTFAWKAHLSLRWLPIVLMGALLVAILSMTPTVEAIRCAIE